MAELTQPMLEKPISAHRSLLMQELIVPAQEEAKWVGKK